PDVSVEGERQHMAPGGAAALKRQMPGQRAAHRRNIDGRAICLTPRANTLTGARVDTGRARSFRPTVARPSPPPISTSMQASTGSENSFLCGSLSYVGAPDTRLRL